MATSWSCGKTVGNRAGCGAQGEELGEEGWSLAELPCAKGERLIPGQQEGNFGNRVDVEMSITLLTQVSCWISGGCAWAGLHTWASAFILGVQSPIWCFPEQGRNNNPWYVT